ncbi:MAG: N-acetylmuramoyl-L-alanine amidase [Thermoleophilaceae bacterium]
MTRRAGLLVVVATLALAALSSSAEAAPALRPSVHHASAAVNGARTFHLARASTHVAVYWRGSSAAHVTVELSRDGRHFGKRRAVQVDDAGEGRKPGVTYGTVMVARGVTAVRVGTDTKLARLTVLSLTDRGAPAEVKAPSRAHAAAAYAQPPVTPRAGWGADESLRYDSTGKETWPPAFYPVQKLIVHHTDTQNNDPDPAATIRSIYYYHAVTQGWGDIGYNFLIDESGRIYEGRHSRTYAPGESPTGEDLNGNGVTGAHAQGFNSGTVGVALLGTLTNQDATPAARHALEQLLAWEASTHGIDPKGSSVYTNPVNGTQKAFPNIAGHRDVNATECPGGVFYATLPTIRADVAAMVAGSPPPPATAKPAATTGTVTAIGSSTATVTGTVNPNGATTTYFFQYGTSTSYGNAAPSPAASAGSGTSAQSVSATLAGLRPKAKYHYRLVASNSAGTTYGADRTFTTAR